MNENQQLHASQVADELENRMLRKYAKGAMEYGTNLWEYSPLELVEMAIDEAIDECVYLITLRQNLENYNPTDLKEQ